MNSIVPCQELRTSRPRVSLDGRWHFSYDPGRNGEAEGWFADLDRLSERIAVPGCSQTRRFRSASGAVRDTEVAIPEHSATIMLKHGCLHPSWYGKRFVVPAAWKGQEVWLHFGGVKPAAEVWINGRKLGETATSRSPIRCALTPWVRYGQKNTVVLKLHWPEVRLDGVLDIFYAWSGIYRSVWVEAVPKAHIADVHVATSMGPEPSAAVQVAVRGRGRSPLRVRCRISGAEQGACFTGQAEVAGRGTVRTVVVRIAMPGARLWSLDSPCLYHAEVCLDAGGVLSDRAEVRFGVRELRVEGFRVLLNGTPVYLRGGCDDRIHPHTVCPPASKEYYRDCIRQARAYGFNYTKSCVDVFTQEFLEAADELGYLVCQELPFGCRAEWRARRQRPTPPFVALWRRELDNLVVADRNHPCVAVYSTASELPVLASRRTFALFCREFPRRLRQLNPGALVIDVTGAYTKDIETPWGTRDTDLLDDPLENADPQTPLQGPLPGIDAVERPFVLHEYNWITSLPDPRLVERYRNTPLVPLHVPEMLAAARAQGFQARLEEFVRCSAQLKYALRKDALELAREHPRVAGYHHWLIHDFPFSPEGVFNEFWEPPADLSADEFRTYNGDTVLLLDDRDQRSFTYGRELPVGIAVSHFGPEPLRRPVLRWELRDGRRVLARGTSRLPAIGCGALSAARPLRIRPPASGSGRACELRCELVEGSRRVCWNHWKIWLFPEQPNALPAGQVAASLPALPFLARDYPEIRRAHHVYSPPAGAHVFATDRLEDAVIAFLEQGNRVLLLSRGALRERPSSRYRTIPINYGRDGNMGTVIRPHPALAGFPHDGWCDLAFVPLIEGAFPMDLAAYRPQRLDPIIRSIGHPFSLEDKAYLFEVGVGRGTLIACSLNLHTTYETNPAARHLLACLLEYLACRPQHPAATITAEQLRGARRM